MIPRWLGVALIVMLSACETQRGYRGPPISADNVGTIVGDSQITMGVPIKAVIRKVDDQVLRFGYSRVDVLPGPHTVLVDCVMENHAAVRFPLTISVRRGHRYVVRAQSAPGNRSCADVTVNER